MATPQVNSVLSGSGPCRTPAVRSRQGGGALRSLTESIVKGNEEAFNRFYALYFDALYRYLLLVSGGLEEAARDSLQETMIRVIRYMKPFDDASAFWNWLRRIAKSSFIDQMRKTKRHDGLIPFSALEKTLDETAQADPDATLENILAGCLKRLRPDEQDLIEGKYMQSRSYAHLAEQLGVTPKAVESRLARIRRKLKAMILERLEP